MRGEINLQPPKRLETPDEVYQIRNIDGTIFSDWAIDCYEDLLTVEEICQSGFPKEHELADNMNVWTIWLGIANKNAGIASGFDLMAKGLLNTYFRVKEGLTQLPAGRESKAHQAKMIELKERWAACGNTLQERIWQANRILKGLEAEKWSPR